ncbi:hypothetical protein HO173_003447 [Letharia columbiana]|uniref:DUF4045 domain-containing protein n=1 Tax=Letharia columbiana TaxID=112416 RepID=A0A8H6L7D6_9LECA|nr:uncharacterized protein HO173_003447 [Letharia columbiana]KAF6238479.1 hypothetical protein HO173_003447 [Letharia columbiana]
MPITTNIDGSEDVNDFLLRIRDLSRRRDIEDEERTRKLEEEIKQGRKERQIRRAERARSISPIKDTSSNAGTPSSIRSGNEMSSQEDFSNTPSFQPPLSGPSGPDHISRKTNGAPTNVNDLGSDNLPRELPQPPLKSQIISTPSPSVAMALSRAGTLSWQQRPSSRGSTGSSSRPLSMVASERNASNSPRAAADPAPTNDDSMSSSQISQSLGSKDPTWFKQTHDRGFGSAAFRRNQDDLSDTASMMGSKRLPGESGESTAASEDRTSPAPDGVRSASPSREGSIRGIPGLVHTSSNSASLASAGGIRSPLPTMSSQRFDPPSNTNSSMVENSSIARTMAMSPSQGRLSPEHLDRPASPTKGLGGFVQSAMLKRSDSVSKRWSAQAGPGLSRGSSITSSRKGYEDTRYPMGGIRPLKESRPNSMSRENSTETTSRPGSSHSNATLTQAQIEAERINISTPLSYFKSDSFQDEVSKPAPIDTKSPPPSKQDDNEPMMSPPASPSKKWSPTKASWLENAINKPDFSKARSPAPQQPAWMAEINRAKQQRGSHDMSKGGNFKEVATGGLIRSPPPGTGCKPPGIGGLPSGFSAGVAVRPRTGSPDRVSQQDESPKTTNHNDGPRESSSSPTLPPKEVRTKGFSFDISLADEKSADSPSAKKYSSQLGSRTQSPTAAKLKPEAPPKIDFKSTLKSRQASGEANSKDESEFKNVFGNLKRTHTQNYKAPDELKDNILRGKAGLALTGGPKRTERKDEFKESILKKKEGMVVPSASTRITSGIPRLQEHNVPEAIAKRQGLTRSESLLSNVGVEGASEPTKAEALAKIQRLRDKPKPALPDKPPHAAANAEKDSTPRGTLGGFTSSLAGMLQRGSSPLANSGKPNMAQSSDDIQDSDSIVRLNDQEAASVGPSLTHATKARARGPKRRLPTARMQDAAKDTPLSRAEPQSKLLVAANRPLGPIHVTKSQTLPAGVYKPESRPLSNITHNNNNNRKTSLPPSPRKPSASINQSSNVRTSPPVSPGPGKALQNKPPAVVKEKLNLSPKDTKIPISFLATPGPPPDTPLKRLANQEPINVPIGSVRDQERREPEPQELDKPTPSVKGAAAVWGRSPMQPFQPRSPVKLPTRKDEEAGQEEAGPRSKGPGIGPVGLGIETTVYGPKSSLDRNLPSPATPSPKSPPLPGKKPASIANRVVSTDLPSPATIALPSPATNRPTIPSQNHPPGVSALLAEVFDEYPSSKLSISIDTQAILISRCSNDNSLKIKTLRKQVFEITDNGRSVPVPSHQEHILFEDRLYLCTHVFGALAGTRTTEVYLWCGDGVPSSSIEDAQLFAKKVAKDNNGKLIILKQGKETTNFFQALGGIVITRRGSGSRPESLSGTAATYLLCGRQHVGQIAFDEVDFSPRSLCKGFPYIVSARSGKIYLWKGGGSGADELGCARLIGMDLGLGGEIEEIDEGHEPDAFWQSFPGGKRCASTAEGASAGHWHLKPSCEKYTTRLYRIDVEAPRPKSSSGFMQWGRRGSAPADTNVAITAQIREIIPFAQLDIVDDGVFVLDIFFEIFVILSIRSLAPAPQHKSTESAAFRAALVFAQEYSILAASAEDRPFVPVSSVVICSRGGSPNVKEVEDIPEGMRRAFRKWDDGKGLGECRVLPLTAALEATG